MPGKYPFRCHQVRPGPCALKRTGSANHIVKFFDLRLLIRYNFAVYLITERRTWWQRNGYYGKYTEAMKKCRERNLACIKVV
jgi:hypothetical protein